MAVSFSRLPSDRNQLALTFDDGPDPVNTLPLLALLKSHGVRATFFLLGQKIRAYPEIAQAIVEAGHAVGNHSDTHAWSLVFSPASLRRELERSQETFESVLKITPRFFRAPRGLVPPWMDRILGEMNFARVGWSLMPGDYWFWHRAPRIERRVLKKVSKGDILVFHDSLNRKVGMSRRETFAALERLLPLLCQTFSWVTVEEGIRKRQDLVSPLPANHDKTLSPTMATSSSAKDFS